MNIHEARSCRITRSKARLGSFCLDMRARSRMEILFARRDWIRTELENNVLLSHTD